MEIIKDLFFDVFLCGIALMLFSSLLLTAGMFLVKYFIWLDRKMFPIKNEGEVIMEELKSCDCKSKDSGKYVSGPWFANGFGWCVCCDGCGRQTPVYKDKQQAIDAWNKRS